MSTIPHVQVMSRDDCCLCDEAVAVVADAAGHGFCTWEKVNVDSDETLSRRYGLDVPVLVIDGEVCFRHSVDASELQQSLNLHQTERQDVTLC